MSTKIPKPKTIVISEFFINTIRLLSDCLWPFFVRDSQESCRGHCYDIVFRYFTYSILGAIRPYYKSKFNGNNV